MAKAPKTAAKKPADKPAENPAAVADGQNQMHDPAAADPKPKAAAKVEAEPAPSPKEQRAKLNAQFEKADEQGKAEIIAETQLGLGVRGY